jgi:hypothetical protein
MLPFYAKGEWFENGRVQRGLFPCFLPMSSFLMRKKMAVFWDITPCSLDNTDKRYKAASHRNYKEDCLSPYSSL